MGGLSLINWGLETPMFLFLINGHLRFRLVMWQVAGNVGLVSLLSLLGALLPARKASRLKPVEALNLSK
jgi:ABC-type lipoprotein release transport system permease subunit